MANQNFIHFVENLCKTIRKTMCIFRVNFCVKNYIFENRVYKLFIPLTFPTFPTTFPTVPPPLFSTSLFHYSTYSTITITKYINKRKELV